MSATTPAEYPHDVFVSYSHKDKAWVSGVLVKALRDGGLRVLVDEDGFAAGNSSITNMTDGVLQSRRTVAVLTQNWVDSEWSQFEGMLSVQQDPTGARGRLIPILREKCNAPPWLSLRTYVDCVNDATISDQMAKLVRSLARPLGAPDVVRTRPVGEGLRTMSELISAGHVREKLLEYELRFNTIVGLIHRLDAFKSVHDQLHHVQLHVYEAILRDAPRIADDDTAVDAIDYYSNDLQRAIGTLREIDARPMFENMRMAWIDTLAEAQKALAVAVKARDEKGVRGAARLLNRVLANEPARIDARLGEAAANLELEAVIDALSFVCRTGRELGMAAEKVLSLEHARDVMEALEENLGILVRGHRLWQDVEVEMRRIETNISAKDASELEISWSDLLKMVTVLWASPGDWVQPLRDDARSVDEAIAAGDPAQMNRFFVRFRKKANTRFFTVDTNLKEQCEELGTIGRPLAEVVEALK
ncbi:MAG TPA: toll/interleukin-1 receptor domain-containing protein [Thermoanaerobaculia bacterium]|nr:toll/interleukin-1 receptor domain-containing protein [Thermoanaerobaculia bacterium]